MIEIIRENRLIHLRSDCISYVMAELPGGVLAHLYFGAPLRTLHPQGLLRHAGIASIEDFTVQECSLDKLPQELPSFGLGDMRPGAVTVEGPDGSWSADLRLVSSEVIDGKPALQDLPATRDAGGSKTLRLTLRDEHTGLKAQLLYTLFEHLPVVARSVRLRNTGSQALHVTRLHSLCLDLPDDKWELITLNGAWGRERGIYRRPLMPGFQGTASRHGASSLQSSPFLALARPGANEAHGEVIAAALIYSGSFTATVFGHQYGSARMLIGLNDEDFSWVLEPGEALQSPEAVLVHSREGIGGMSAAFHALLRGHLLPQRWVSQPRPVLFNSWEAAYFDFDEDKLVAIAKAAAEAGADLFVLDDGWFGHRDNDCTSLGDWYTDRRKLPGGLGCLADKVRDTGLQFGIWMEPEMISPESDLYHTHPDWAMQIPGREPITSRHQLILDVSREDVQDFMVESVSQTIRDSGAVYIKWDMNRNYSNIGSAVLPPERQRELPHRYMIGLYRVMKRLTEAFPDVLFEGCSGGGGRFDAGLLYFCPQYWCSDNTDVLSRCRIQYGTTIVFPPSTMGCHVSAVPNHQTARVTPLNARFAAALCGSFGYELDPRKLTDEEREEVHRQIAYAHETEKTRLNGRFYRLLSPFEGNDTAWISVREDQREAVLTFIRERSQVNFFPTLLPLRGLNPDFTYRVEETQEVYGGDELMQAGLLMPVKPGDAEALVYTIRTVEA